MVDPETDSIIQNNRAGQCFRAALSRIFSEAQLRLDREYEDELLVTLLNASLPDSASADKSTPVVRTRAIQRALDYIDDNRGDAPTIREICEHNDVALRTLNRAFRERFGIGPKSYLKRQRLSAVRTELLVSRSDALIADVANKWGFWHMGQFARDYKNLFGELPSETLKRQGV